MRRRGFALVWCLMAAALAGLTLPPLADAIAQQLAASAELARRGEAYDLAFSCLELAQARGAIPVPDELPSDLGHDSGAFELEIDAVSEELGRQVRVKVSWLGLGGRKTLELRRTMP